MSAKQKVAPRKRAALVPAKVDAKERARTKKILARLEKAYPDWGPTLTYSNAFELLVATILSAQASDEGVNRVTASLFKKYRRPEDYLHTPQAELERDIKSTGFFRQKAKAIRGSCQDLLDKFGGEVPRDIDGLTQLHGVGRKTASVVLGGAYGIPAIAVDRHVARVAQRLRFTKQSDPDKIEFDLKPRIPEREWFKANWLLILHGRRICRPTPECPRCPVLDLCPYPNKTRA